MAVFPVAAGHTDMSSTSSMGYIPQIWTTKMLRKFYKRSVFGSISNTEYEGVIKNFGDTIYIRTTPDITIRDWVKGQKLIYESPESAKVSMQIQRAKYYAFGIDDVDKRQADVPFQEKWSEDAGEAMKVKIDNTLLAAIPTDAHASNKGLTAGATSSSYNMGVSGTPLALTKTNILEFIADADAVLAENDAPDDGHFMVLPVWATNLIHKSDYKDASMVGGEVSAMVNGRIGKIYDMEIFRSNNLTSVTDGAYTAWNLLFGTKEATAFASQFTENGIIDNPDAFGKLIRGLQVFDFKVLQSKLLGNGYVRKG